MPDLPARWPSTWPQRESQGRREKNLRNVGKMPQKIAKRQQASINHTLKQVNDEL